MRAAPRSRRWRHLWYFIFAMNRGYCSSAMRATRYRERRKEKKEGGKKKKKIGLLLRFKIVKLRADEIIVGRMECWASFRGFFDVRHLVSFLIKKTSSLKLRRRIICWHFSIVNWANEMIPFFLNDRIVMIEYSVLENYIYNWNDSSSSFNVKFELLNQEIIAFIKEVIC